ncbi:uncharacterized protein LOC144374370 [Ictidomys tridecemlineatus]
MTRLSCPVLKCHPHPSSVRGSEEFGEGNHSGDRARETTLPPPLLLMTGLLSLSRDIEYKELQLSLDQVSTSKSQNSWRTTLSTSQETRKLAKPKNTNMKTKLRTYPYPPQGHFPLDSHVFSGKKPMLPAKFGQPQGSPCEVACFILSTLPASGKCQWHYANPLVPSNLSPAKNLSEPPMNTARHSLVPNYEAPAAARTFGKDTAPLPPPPPPPPPSFPSCGHYREEPALGQAKAARQARPPAMGRGRRWPARRPSAARRRPPSPGARPRSCPSCCSTTTACWGAQRLPRRGSSAAPEPPRQGRSAAALASRPQRRLATRRAPAALPGSLGHYHQRSVTRRAGSAQAGRPQGEAIGQAFSGS